MDLKHHCRILRSRGIRGASRRRGRARLMKVRNITDRGPGTRSWRQGDEPNPLDNLEKPGDFDATHGQHPDAPTHATVYQRLYTFLIAKSILCHSQYGFSKKHSTINAMITEFITDAQKATERQEICSWNIFGAFIYINDFPKVLNYSKAILFLLTTQIYLLVINAYASCIKI